MRLCESFSSIQGEGIMMGEVTYFLRSAGCNLSCEWCDTLYSHGGGEDISVPEMIGLTEGYRNVCVTGGEPLLQDDIYDLLDALLREGKRVVLETNGSVDISKVPVHENMIISMDMKCPSSGMNDRMKHTNIAYLKTTDQLKFVISGKEDLEYAVSFINSNEPVCNIIFTPVGGMDLRPLAEEVIERKLSVRVLPQLHKIIWGGKRSV